MHYKVLGHSTLDQPIGMWSTKIKPKVLVVAGVHGDEYEGIYLANLLIKHFLNSDDSAIALISCLNPDGVLLDQRQTLNSVDLNRNLPTFNWTSIPTNPRYLPGATPCSEPENRIFMEVLERHDFPFVISLHSFKDSLLLYPTKAGKDDHMTDVLALSVALNIPVVQEMAYTVTGSLTSLSREQNFYSLTVELLRGLDR